MQGSGSRPSLCPPSRALSRLCRGPGEESPRQWWPWPGEPRAAWLLEGQAGPGGGVLAPSSWLSSHPWAEPVPGVCVYVCVGWGTGWELGWLGALLLSWGGTPGGGGRPLRTEGTLFPRLLRELCSALTKSHLCPRMCRNGCPLPSRPSPTAPSLPGRHSHLRAAWPGSCLPRAIEPLPAAGWSKGPPPALAS